MTGLVVVYMATVTAAALAGVALSQLLTRRQDRTRWVESFAAGVMLAVCMLYLIPDAIAFQHGIAGRRPESTDHVSIGYALSLGFLSLLSIERYLLGHRKHGHDHAHHDEPGGTAPQPGVAWSALVALWLHGLFDGVALYAAGVMPAMGTALALAIILHKVPESAALVALLRRGALSKRAWGAALSLYLLATPLGMLAAAQLLTLLSEHGVSLLLAFVAGSLLHLVTGHLLPEVTGHHHDLDTHDEQDHHQVAPFLIMLGGFATLLAARLLGPS